MKFFLLACFITLVFGKPQNFIRPTNYYNPPAAYYNPQYNYIQRPFIPITSQTQEINPDGSYQYSFTTADGKAAQESGYLKNRGTNLEAETVTGSYSYTAPDGTPISVRYVADENGFRPEGAHLPTPPPIPPAILRSLEIIGQNRYNPTPQPTYYQPPYNNPYYQRQY